MDSNLITAVKTGNRRFAVIKTMIKTMIKIIIQSCIGTHANA